ncbi:MvdC/MvdD family ATP grasp protein [Nonomuraea cavernae]|uniref:MvdC/MvdD family ATP grasp protein n=1 Tax=Nonomuraea cavernae TaxID=2045107 RepID=UPI001CD9C852|nr:ATP-dependent carboxylate-amine ligase [Nonomuraea cavernae]MCA2186297.1 ATP-dependent carboxylate-amine ligase [Nonomuraea cavernae]
MTSDGDEHADRVVKPLMAAGADVVVFDPASFPTAATLEISHSGDGSTRRVLGRDGRRIVLDELTALWYRRPLDPVVDPRVTAPDHVAEECRLMTEGLWDSLGCLTVPASRPVIDRAARKPYQLELAGRLGFELPATLITNDPESFLDFYDRHEGRVITKPVHGNRLEADGERFGRFAAPVTPMDVAYADALRLCPVIIQAYVPKHVEIRVTVVGGTIFAAEIHSQVSNHTRYDWRHYDPGATPIRPHELPAEISRRCLELVERLGLAYGAIDLIRTPDGRHVFLEINPNGQFLWIEDAAGLPVSAAVGELLMRGGT